MGPGTAVKGVRGTGGAARASDAGIARPRRERGAGAGDPGGTGQGDGTRQGARSAVDVPLHRAGVIDATAGRLEFDDDGIPVWHDELLNLGTKVLNMIVKANGLNAEQAASLKAARRRVGAWPPRLPAFPQSGAQHHRPDASVLGHWADPPCRPRRPPSAPPRAWQAKNKIYALRSGKRKAAKISRRARGTLTSSGGPAVGPGAGGPPASNGPSPPPDCDSDEARENTAEILAGLVGGPI